MKPFSEYLGSAATTDPDSAVLEVRPANVRREKVVDRVSRQCAQRHLDIVHDDRRQRLDRFRFELPEDRIETAALVVPGNHERPDRGKGDREHRRYADDRPTGAIADTGNHRNDSGQDDDHAHGQDQAADRLAVPTPGLCYQLRFEVATHPPGKEGPAAGSNITNDGAGADDDRSDEDPNDDEIHEPLVLR